MGLILAGEFTSASRLAAQRDIAVKAADESVASSTTLQDDDHLTVQLDANTTYLFEWQFVYNCPAVANGFKAGFVIPAGTTGVVSGYGSSQAAFAQALPASAGTNVWGNTGGADAVGFYFGRIVTVGTAGTFKLQWAQNVSNAAAVILRRGSFIRFECIG